MSTQRRLQNFVLQGDLNRHAAVIELSAIEIWPWNAVTAWTGSQVLIVRLNWFEQCLAHLLDHFSCM